DARLDRARVGSRRRPGEIAREGGGGSLQRGQRGAAAQGGEGLTITCCTRSRSSTSAQKARLARGEWADGRFLAKRRSMETGMAIVTLSIASREEVSRRAAAAFRGEELGAHISFDSVDLLWNTLTRKRWEILRAMTGQ